LNLLSVAAACGVMVLVWQDGLGSEAIWGIELTGAITVEMPAFAFAFLFGVSMDYQRVKPSPARPETALEET
jgi:putative drug exporter of the RND superfamily